MNKVYKVVWSKVRNAYVVVSELAKNHGKSKSVRTAIVRGVLAAAIVGMPVSGLAALPQPNQPLVNSENATGIGSVVVGQNTTASGAQSTAMGNGTKAEGESATAMGYKTQAKGSNALAVGHATVAEGSSATAMGYKTQAKGSNALAVGHTTSAEGDNSLVAGYATRAAGDNSVAVGILSVATGEGALASGVSSSARGANSTALSGGMVGSNGANSVAMGAGAQALVRDAVAIGSGSVADREAGAAGWDPGSRGFSSRMDPAWRSTANAVSVGNTDQRVTRQITGVAAGSEDTDADSNYNNDGAKGENALAAGSYASALKDSVAVGREAQANDMRSVAIGMGAKTFSKADSQAAIDTAGGNTAIGYNAQAGAKDQLGLATAVGKDAKATGWGSSAYGVGADAHSSWSTALGNQSRANETKGIGGTAIGTTARADEAYATAVGLGAEATAVNSTALGMQAKATQKDSVALGAGSVDRAATKETKGTIPLSDGTTRDFGNFAGNNPTGVVSVGAKDKERQVINVAAGKVSADSTDAINGSQLYSLAGEVGKNTEAISKNTQDIQNIKNTSMKYGGDTGDVIKKKMNNQVNVIGGIRDTSKLTTADNIGVVSDGTDNLKVRLAKNLNLGNDGSVTTGDTTINNNGVTIHNGPSITKDGIDAGGKTISNVANGTNATDAVNKGQLDEAVRTTNSEVSRVAHGLARLDSRVNKVGANAAALAALHPQDFDPDDKWDFAAGYGNYKDAHAVAVGAFYRPNEDTMLSVGGSFGGGENMVNAGVTFKLGQKNSVGRSKVAMAKEIIDLKTEVQLLKNQNQTILKALHATGAPGASTTGVAFSDVPQGHWAYTYVKSLADKGYLKGYPDGEFKGNLAMSRYEYAAIIYRALQNGAPLDGNMVQSMKEFKPEIEAAREADRFRVDRISGKDNDRHKVERVRVNSAKQSRERFP